MSQDDAADAAREAEFTQLRALKAKELSLEFENHEVRRSLRKSTSDVALAREYELLSADRQRMAQLVEQLKMEKEHLIESVVNLSNEVDEVQRARYDDNLKFKQEMLRHSEEDKTARRLKYRIGLGIIDLLKAKNCDALILQEVQMHITNASFSRLPTSKAASGENSKRVPFTSTENAGSGGDQEEGNTAYSGRSRRRRYRNKQRLDRDEEGSDISSVSTHRTQTSTNTGGATASSDKRFHSASKGKTGRGRRQDRTRPLDAANEVIRREAVAGGEPAKESGGGCLQA